MLESGSVPQRPKWGLEPIQFLLLKPPTWDMGTLCKPVCKPSLLWVNLFSIMLGGQMPIAPAPCRASTLPSSPHSAMECPRVTATHTRMAAKLQELLSRAVLNTSSPVPGHNTSKRSTSVTLGAPLLIGSEDPLGKERADSATPEMMATSLQASPWVTTIDDTIPISHLPSLTPALETS